MAIFAWPEVAILSGVHCTNVVVVLANFLLSVRLYFALPAAVAKVPGTTLTISAGPLRILGEPVAVTGGATTREPAEQVDAFGVLGAVVHPRLGALVEVHHARDRVQRPVDVQIAVADVAAASLQGKRTYFFVTKLTHSCFCRKRREEK